MNNISKPTFLILSLYQNHVSYAGKEFYIDDLIDLNYSIIFVLVQDSKIKNQTTFDTLLKVKLKKNNYYQIYKIELESVDIGCKIRIYRKSDSNLIISNKNFNYSIIKFKKQKYNKTKLKYGESKMALILNMNFIFNDIKYKISIINTDLYYDYENANSNTIKKEQFLQIINDFNLISKLKNQYNIFFVGNFNFKFIKFLKDFNKLKFENISKNIIQNKNKNNLNKYLTITKKNNIEIGNQLYKYLLSLKNETSD